MFRVHIMIKCFNLDYPNSSMKKHLIISIILALSAFSIQADGVNLTCAPYQSVCVNCPEYQTLFPFQQFSSDPGSLDIEADQSEISQDGIYHLTGNVELRSDAYFLSADDVEFSTIDQSTKATDNVKFQDATYFITGEQFSANVEDNNILAVIDNARYQEIKSNANGTAKQVVKTENKVIFNDATYSYCPINQNDWQIRAETIEANLDTNRGIADHATMVFMGYPIFYFPKYSWVLEGRGSGFLPPDFDMYTESNNNERAYRLKIPYYLNLAPDRDLVLAYTYMSTRGSVFEGKYRQLIKRNNTTQKEYEKTKEKY